LLLRPIFCSLYLEVTSCVYRVDRELISSRTILRVGDDGPSGVLVCSENWISFKHQGHVEIRAPIPRRADLPVERGDRLTSSRNPVALAAVLIKYRVIQVFS
jgi:hypothetical protein